MSTPAPPYKMAPCSPESEMAVLGCCQLHPEAYHEAVNIIGNRNVFCEKSHSAIWGVLQRWYADHNTQPDDAWFISQLIDHDGAATVASECINAGCLTPNLSHYCIELLKLWRQRQNSNLAATLARCADAGDHESMEAVLHDLNECNTVSDNNALQLTDVANAPEVPAPLFSNGIPPAGFGLLIGADGAGKGFLLADMLLSCATGKPVSIHSLSRHGKPLRTLYLSYEDGAPILKWRMDKICQGAGMYAGVWCNAQRDGCLSFLCEPEPLYIQSGNNVPQVSHVSGPGSVLSTYSGASSGHITRTLSGH